MKSRTNSLVWMIWGGAVALATVSTRNPLYLTLNLLAVSIVYISLPHTESPSRIWGLVIKIGLLVAGMTVAFNLLTAHVGDRILAHVPDQFPIVGGAITGNALLYGLSTAIAILTLIVAAAVFGSVVDRASLLRTVPASLSSAGIAAIIGLSFFPQTLVSLREVREAQAARGFRVRSVRDLRPLVIPVLSMALDGAFNLAEAMESRAFGGETMVNTHSTWPFVSGVFVTLVAISLLIGGQTAPASVAAVAGIALVALGLLQSGRGRTSYRAVDWRMSDRMLLATSTATILTFAAAVAVSSHAIEWSPFPMLTVPPFSPILGSACVLLAAPSLTLGIRP